ncbi:MAG: M23 family metallopeptidase [Ruthenibacterium lactatiformans]
MERARFPMEFLRVTQGPNVGSHAGSKAMDFGGKDTGKDPIYAPFTGKFVRVRKDSSHESYLESLEPVEFANGVVDYMTLTFMHDDVLDVKTGQIVRQGEKIGDEGGFGGGRPNRFGAHLHIEASRGRNIAYQVQNGAGTYCTPNQVNIWDALWVGGDVQILKDGGYSWKRDVKKEENDMEFLEVTSERCEVFTEANVNSVDRTFNNGRLVKGGVLPDSERCWHGWSVSLGAHSGWR